MFKLINTCLYYLKQSMGLNVEKAFDIYTFTQHVITKETLKLTNDLD